jgi:hypothetical protein
MGYVKRALAVLFPLLLLLLPVAAAAQTSITNTATVTANNGFTANGDGMMSVTTQVQTPVPTLSAAGLAALAVSLAGFALVVIRRQARRRS